MIGAGVYDYNLFCMKKKSMTFVITTKDNGMFTFCLSVDYDDMNHHQIIIYKKVRNHILSVESVDYNIQENIFSGLARVRDMRTFGSN